VAAAKDRLDHTIDRVRTVRTDQFRYTRNYKTDRIFLQPQYRDKKDYVIDLRQAYAAGELSPKLTEIYFGERPAEELYDVKVDPSQIHNLVGDAKFQKELVRHRQFLDDWLAKGDEGAGEESAEELAYQAQGHKWGNAVNPEYESVRTDSDGDGMSDAWEKINGRDADDAKLLFTFDCGGWQTEGWKGTQAMGNIAGRLGHLDFHLPDGEGLLVRDKLKLAADKNQGKLAMNVRCSQRLTVQLLARSTTSDRPVIVATIDVAAKPDFLEQFAILSDRWTGTIESLQLRFQSEPDALVEIDSIMIK
ncbi:MAG: hypothetical protein HKN47_09140, partial [Pirellulaceae bacterium]|nr:hypothetical protein [Pirellulaceae bacterium]